jgi:hypothetical protein
MALFNVNLTFWKILKCSVQFDTVDSLNNLGGKNKLSIHSGLRSTKLYSKVVMIYRLELLASFQSLAVVLHQAGRARVQRWEK